MKNSSKDLVLTLINFFYLPNSYSNFISLDLLNDIGIYYHNKEQIFYDQSTQKIFIFAKQYKISFLLYSLNLFSRIINFFREHKVYKRVEVNQIQNKRLHLIFWYQRLDNINFTILKNHLTYYNIKFINDIEGLIYNSRKRAKTKKQYNCNLQPKAIKSYQYIYMHLVGLIMFIGF